MKSDCGFFTASRNFSICSFCDYVVENSSGKDTDTGGVLGKM